MLGLAKDNVKEQKSIDESFVKTENSSTKTEKIYHFSSKEEAQKFKEEVCTNVFIFLWEWEVTYSDGSTGIITEVSIFTVEYECGKATTNVYVY